MKAYPSIFLDSGFIETYLKTTSSRFYALTACSEGDGQTAVALSPDGRLRIRLDKEAYARLGITGTRSTYDDGLKPVVVWFLSTCWQ